MPFVIEVTQNVVCEEALTVEPVGRVLVATS
jgi:hypothetical protein